MTKSFTGNFFEDFKPGQIIRHATPRTLTDGDSALYIALTAQHLGSAVRRRLRHRSLDGHQIQRPGRRVGRVGRALQRLAAGRELGSARRCRTYP